MTDDVREFNAAGVAGATGADGVPVVNDESGRLGPDRHEVILVVALALAERERARAVALADRDASLVAEVVGKSLIIVRESRYRFDPRPGLDGEPEVGWWSCRVHGAWYLPTPYAPYVSPKPILGSPYLGLDLLGLAGLDRRERNVRIVVGVQC